MYHISVQDSDWFCSVDSAMWILWSKEIQCTPGFSKINKMEDLNCIKFVIKKATNTPSVCSHLKFSIITLKVA